MGLATADLIHPNAYVEGAEIGDRTRVWQFASVIRGAKLGADCNIGACSIIDGAEIGDNCLVGHGAQLHPGLKAGNGVFFGPGCIICNDRWPSFSKENFFLEDFAHGFVAVRIMDGASIGAGAIILPGVTIGKNAMIAAGAVVDQNVMEDHLWSRIGLVKIKPEWRKKRMRAAA